MPARQAARPMPTATSSWWRTAVIAVAASGVAFALGAAAEFGLAGYLTATVAIAVAFPFACSDVRPLPDIAAAALGAAGCWLLMPRDGITVTAGVRCGFVLWSLLTLEGGVLCLSRTAGLSRDAIAAACSAAALLWLGWPLWLESAPPLLVCCHPLLAMDGVLAPVLGVWTEQPVAYRIMSLGQDVPYTLPSAIWPVVISHAGSGVVAFTLGRLLVRRGERRALRG